MRTIGVVPAKQFSRGKSRLSHVLSSDERESLARSLFDHVVRVALASRVLHEVVVVTDGDDVATAAIALGARVLRDPPSRRLGEIVDAAIADAATRADAVLVLMADLPHLAVDDVRALVAKLDDAAIAIAPDLRDEGTNALAMRIGASPHTEFGHADSFARHAALADRVTVAVHRSAGLGFDVDTEADWRTFADAAINRRGGEIAADRSA